jgi:hypothetical protein
MRNIHVRKNIQNQKIFKILKCSKFEYVQIRKFSKTKKFSPQNNNCPNTDTDHSKRHIDDLEATSFNQHLQLEKLSVGAAEPHSPTIRSQRHKK